MGPRSPYEAICFDLGHTLVHLDTLRVARVLAELDIVVTPSVLASADQWARADLDHPDLIGGSTSDDWWLAYLDALLVRAGVSAGPAHRAARERLDRVNAEQRLCCALAPGIPELLGRLRGAGWRLAVVSNSGGDVGPFLESIGLAAHFDAIIDSFCVHVEKPDPRIFAIALARLGVPPSRAVHVGDLYHVDVVGAEQAGLTGVLLDPLGVHPRGAALVLSRLEELERSLETSRRPPP